jgi:hypothetical protein
VRVQLFGSRLVEKCVRALQLKGIPFLLVPPRSPADFKRWNPQTRKMPVLDVAFGRAWVLRSRYAAGVGNSRGQRASPDGASRRR